MNAAIRILSCMLPAGILAAIWFPWLEHYYVPAVRIPESSLGDFLEQPSDPVLAALGEQFLGAKVTDTSGFSEQAPEARLHRAGLFRVGMELDRFERAGAGEGFAAIADFVIDFSRHANSRFSWDEFLWNDHAVANRVFVLAQFWRHYRRHPGFAENDARAVLEHVAKNVQFLLRDDHFTYWSNHGVMQSLALLHAANAFPALPGRDRMIEVALDRLGRELEFFVSDSGWVMEHSAGYQEFGSNLLGTLLVELELLGRPVPPAWQSKATRARRILDWLVRPDGSLPNFGDSYTEAADPGDAAGTCAGRPAGVLQAPEGYFVAWDVREEDGATTCAQTTVVWTAFVSNAHGRPNQLSLHYWVDGVDFALASGYWPYGDPDRIEAIGWRGSNAPHLARESGAPARSVRHLGACLGDDFRFIDLERPVPAAGASVRRQVVDLGVGGVLVLDSGEGPAGASRESVWRIDPRVALVAPGERTVQEGRAGSSGSIRVAGDDVAVEALERVYAREGHAAPAKFSAVAARGPVPSWVVTSPVAEPVLIALTPGRAAYRLAAYESPERWRIEDDASGLTVERSDTLVRLEPAGDGTAAECDASGGAVPADATRAMEASFRELAREYPTFKPWTAYRLKASLLVVVLFAAQLGVLVVLSSTPARRFRRYAEPALVACWLGLGGYLTLSYLAQ